MNGAKEKTNSLTRRTNPPREIKKPVRRLSPKRRWDRQAAIRPLEFVSPHQAHLPYLLRPFNTSRLFFKCYTLVPLEGRRRMKRKTKFQRRQNLGIILSLFFHSFTFTFFSFLLCASSSPMNDGGSSPDFPPRLSLFTQRQKILIGAEKRRSAI